MASSSTVGLPVDLGPQGLGRAEPLGFLPNVEEPGYRRCGMSMMKSGQAMMAAGNGMMGTGTQMMDGK